jgi:hypothetical protein
MRLRVSRIEVVDNMDAGDDAAEHSLMVSVSAMKTRENVNMCPVWKRGQVVCLGMPAKRQSSKGSVLAPRGLQNCLASAIC